MGAREYNADGLYLVLAYLAFKSCCIKTVLDGCSSATDTIVTFADNPFFTVDLHNVVRSSFKSTKDRAVKFIKTKRSLVKARFASSNSCVITILPRFA